MSEVGRLHRTAAVIALPLSDPQAWGRHAQIHPVGWLDDAAAHPTELGRFAFPFADAIKAHGDLVYVASVTDLGHHFIENLNTYSVASKQMTE